jgi:hypothetical protein
MVEMVGVGMVEEVEEVFSRVQCGYRVVPTQYRWGVEEQPASPRCPREITVVTLHFYIK